MRRLSTVVEETVTGTLPQLGPLVEWEVIASAGEDSTVRWLVGVGAPVKETGDWAMLYTEVDPHDPAEIARAVRRLYESVTGVPLSG